MRKLVFLFVVIISTSFVIPRGTSTLNLPQDSSPYLENNYTNQGSIWISLDSEDFANTDYLSIENCALAKAIKRQLKVSDCIVGPDNVSWIDYKPNMYRIVNGFSYTDFERDKVLSETIHFNIQYIHLVKYTNYEKSSINFSSY